MENTKVNSYKNLIVWRRAIELVVATYELTDQFPKEEIFGLTSQMKRSAVSIPSNIAEGRYRGTKNNYLHFLRISYGSGAELETQIEIAKKLPRTGGFDYSKIDSLLEETMKMLNAMIRKFNPKS